MGKSLSISDNIQRIPIAKTSSLMLRLMLMSSFFFFLGGPFVRLSVLEKDILKATVPKYYHK